MIRKIWLESESGELFMLSNHTKTVATNLTGFGTQNQNKFIVYQNSYKKYKSEIALSKLSSTIVFLTGYEGYYEFLKYIEKEVNLKLHYNVGSIDRYCYVEVGEIKKSELVSNSLFCDVHFEKTSMWLIEKTSNIEVDVDENGKVYPHTFPYTFSESYQGAIELLNEGYKPAPTIIQISGEVKDPIVYVYKDDELVSSLRVFIESENVYHKIIIDSREHTQKIVKLENQVVTNIYELQDFERENFLYLPVGRSKVVFDPGKLSTATCKIMYVENYLSS